MTRALILGASGQDGRLLAAALRSQNVEVTGLDRVASDGVSAMDLRDAAAFENFLRATQPDLIFHFAAVHGSAGTPYETIWRDMLGVNLATLHVALEYQRCQRRDAGLLYASSIKAFGESLPAHIDDTTPMRPQSLYGISKQAATEAIRYYRSNHGIKASALHFSNHESWLRPPGFFIPRLVDALAASLQDATHLTTLHTLDFWCDWGSAAEYMQMSAALALGDHLSQDYVFGTGCCVHARTLARDLFAIFGLKADDHLRETATGGDRAPYRIDCVNLRAALGRTAQTNILETCLDILARNHSILRPTSSHG